MKPLLAPSPWHTATLASVLAAAVWTWQGHLQSFVRDGTVRYGFTPPSLWWGAADLLVAGALLTMATTVAAAWLRQYGQEPESARAIRPFTPLYLAGANLLSLLVLVRPTAPAWSPWLFVTADFYPCVVAAAVAMVVHNLDRASDGSLGRVCIAAVSGSPRARRRGAVVLAAVAVGVVTLTSPVVRFSSIVTGDEPKYLRYCESWWQGLGVDIEAVKDVSETPASERAHVTRTLAMLGPALRRDLRAMRLDIRLLTSGTAHWGDTFNRGVDAGAAFLRGKRGGLYQVHNPGLSLLLLPAYSIDRIWFDTHRGRFADTLYAVNLECLLIFAVLTVAVARVATAAGASDPIAAAVALAIALSLPVGAFAFQFYPEVAAALMVAVALWHLVAPVSLTPARALGLGLAVGFLGWLHVRFLGTAVTALGWLLVVHHQRRRSLTALLAGFGAPTLALCVYAYHITGSVLPNAVYGPTGVEVQFAWTAVPRGLLAVFFDRDYGLLPVNPALWLMLPGLGVLWARREWRMLAVVVSLALALVVPTAGHGLTFANTTPLRFLLAVIPVAAVPMALALTASSGRPFWTAVVALLLVLAVRNCVMHDALNAKTALTMREAGVSGWNLSLVFPTVDTDAPLLRAGSNLLLLGVWCAAALGALAFGCRLARPAPAPTRRLPPELIGASVLCILAGVGSVAIAAGAPSRGPQFLYGRPALPGPADGRAAAAAVPAHVTPPVLIEAR